MPPCVLGIEAASVAAVAAGLMPERAAMVELCIPSPVASAMTLPLFLDARMLSIRSGTVTNAKDPARDTMRGNAIKRSIGEGFRYDVALDAEALIWPKAEMR